MLVVQLILVPAFAAAEEADGPATGTADTQAGAQAGDQAGDEAGTPAGDQTGAQTGDQAGAQTGDQPGTQAFTLAITTPTAHAEGTAPVLEYKSGETITGLAVMTVSGREVNIPGGKLTLKLPKQAPYISLTGFTDSNLAASNRRYEDEQNWYMEYTYGSLNGATWLEAPFVFKFNNGTTPDGTSTTATLTLSSADGQELATTQTTFVARAKAEYGFEKISVGGRQLQTPDGNTEMVAYAEFFAVDASTATHTPAQGTPVRFYFNVLRPSNIGGSEVFGRIDPTTIRLEDTLAEGVELAPSSIERGWAMEGRTAVFEAPISKFYSNYRSYYTYVDLLYKNVPVREADGAPKWHKNVARGIVNPGLDGEAQAGSDNGWVVFEPKTVDYGKQLRVSKSSRPYSFVYDDGNIWHPGMVAGSTEKNRIQFHLEWSQNNDGDLLTGTRNGGEKTIVTEVSDYDLDPRAYFTGFTLEGASNAKSNVSEYHPTTTELKKAAKILYGVKESGERVELARDFSTYQRIEINDVERQFVRLTLEFPDGLAFDNGRIDAKVTADLLPSELEKWGRGEYKERQSYVNRAEMVGHNPLTKGIARSTDTSVVYVGPVSPAINGSSGNSYRGITYRRCDGYEAGVSDVKSCPMVMRFQDLFTPIGDWPVAGRTLKNFRRVVMLPEGVEFDRIQSLTIGGEPADKSVVKPRMDYNYNDTGKTALILEFGDLHVPMLWHYNNATYVSYFLRVTDQINPGNHPIMSYAVWDNNDKAGVLAGGMNYRYWDALDVDRDGNTNEVFLQTYHGVNVVPPAEVSSRKHVSVDGRAWTKASPNLDLGSDFYFRQSVRNGGLTPLSQLTVIDVLPHLNDHAIVANEDGQYPARTWKRTNAAGEVEVVEHSAFATPLVEPLSAVPANAAVLERFDAFYSLTPQGADLASVRDAQWLTEQEVGERWEQVTAIRLVMKAGQRLGANEQVEFVSKHKVPYSEQTRKLAAQSAAVNSLAASTNGTNFAEGNPAVVNAATYVASGVLFVDDDKDGVIDPGEGHVKGKTVSLVNSDGSPATHPDGTPVAPVTLAADGSYRFEVYKRGSYKVEFTRPALKEFGPAGAGADASVSHVDRAQTEKALSAEFVLDPFHATAVRNAGLVSQSREVVVRKVDGAGAPLAGATFTLTPLDRVGGELTARSEADGRAVFAGVDFGRYTLTETVAPQGYQAAAPQEITVSADSPYAPGAQAAYVEVVNQPITGTVTVRKTEAGDQGTSLADATFGLFAVDGAGVVADVAAYTAQSQADGVATFTGVRFGKYELRETVAPVGYQLSTATKEVVVSTQGETVAVGDWENAPITSTVTVTKVDADDATKKLAGVVFALRQSGKNVYRATTDGDGVATFAGVRYGVYELVEVSTLENYVLDTAFKESVRVSAQGQSVDVGSVTNAVKRADVVGVKKDQAGVPLSGAVFELRQAGKVVASATSGVDGVVRFGAVPWGEYELVETKAPAGYKLNARAVVVSVKQSGGQVSLDDIVNVKEEPATPPTPTQTPSLTPSQTPSQTPSETPSETPSGTPTPSETPSQTPTPSQPGQPTAPPASSSPTPSAAPAPGRTGKLAKTGSDAAQVLPWALALLLAGAALQVARRRS
ncbi:SpaA isopeptide-forming pilin-related protein [Buchananella felis]|uniref:SpaA isopeptide-forming pilin-related protein n=1 Tax=Buchananella felis TaxID=3231492 RepID=UPI00352844E2